MNAAIRLGLLLAVMPAGASAQSFLEEFSYDGLGLSGIGMDAGRVWSDRITGTWSPGVRVDYGLIAPRVRVVLGGSYYRGPLDATEIAEFESSLQRVVTDPTGDATISVGQIDWGTLDAYVDLHYMVPAGERFMWYAGLGLGMQLWNGSGTAIEGTFVEDALDTVGAAMNGMTGFEFALSPTVRVLLEARGGLTSEIRTVATRLGVMYRFPTSGS